MFERRRMHPATIVVTFIKHLRELIFPFIIFIFLDRDRMFSFLYLGAIILWFIGLIAYVTVYWYRFYYWIEDRELRMEYGVFIKKRRFIPQERIQTIDTSEGIIQRLFGLVRVQVETAGGGIEAEAVLSAVRKEEAELLREALLDKGQTELQINTEAIVDESEPFSQNERDADRAYTISWTSLFVVGTTSGGIGVVLSAVIAFVTQFDQFVPYEKIMERFDIVLQTSIFYIAMIVFIVLFLSWLISIVMTMLKYGNFKVVKQDEELFISRGIIEKRQLTIPLERIQAIRVSQNILRQPFGFATVYLESAGSSGGKEADFSMILFPLVKMNKAAALIREFIPAYEMKEEINPLPKRSLIRYMIRLIVPAVILSTPVAYFSQPYGFFAFVSIPLAGLLAFSQYKEGGWSISENQLQLSYRLLNKNIIMIRKKRVQSFEWKESFFQRRKHLLTINAAIKTSISHKNFRVLDVEREDGQTIFSWYSYQKKQG